MNQVVVFTGVEEKAKGTNKRGPWVLRVFTAAGGSKYQTFDADLGAEIPLDKSIELEYALEDSKDGKYQNNVIKGWKLSSETVAPAAQDSEPVQSVAGNGGAAEQQSIRDQKQRSKEEVRYTAALQIAATIIGSPQWKGDADPETLFSLAGVITEEIAS